MTTIAYGKHTESNERTRSAIRKVNEMNSLGMTKDQYAAHIAMEAKKRFIQIIGSYRQVEVTTRSTGSGVLARCAERLGYSVPEIIGYQRNKGLVIARHIAVAEVYVECPQLSLPQIGRLFGGRDHSSILYIVKKMGVHISQTHQERAYTEQRRDAYYGVSPSQAA